MTQVPLIRQAGADTTVVFKHALASRAIHCRDRQRRSLPDGE